MWLLSFTELIQNLNVFVSLFFTKSICKDVDYVCVNFVKLLELYGIS